ncbi:precorrin-6y C5,15-methyltransferase (decarboxylating) subunit CbiE [Jongsikchunia kroppenstedtii]|uniref:precorrin-6y C5,15-methyltransferase (decarboxylating) subunit CbiE n=1 Tax=Jongsikchunia kroppenstedtii TaxID=1121721 RepID=UPI00037A09E6|nr:precorrin-6y C5,15-methyltransferase (decarboxylating) subunit CbiE [Jongsikchunia kroppenstedtii]
MRVVVVGIGADGWDGLGGPARRELLGATEIYGSRRQLDLLDAEVDAGLIAWHSPMSQHLGEVLAGSADREIHVLASGDPTYYGVGSTIIESIGAEHVTIIPAVSSVTLACARLGWDQVSTPVESLLEKSVLPTLAQRKAGDRMLFLSRDAATAGSIAEALRQSGFADSRMWVLNDLGGPDELIQSSTAQDWRGNAASSLNIVGVVFSGGFDWSRGEWVPYVAGTPRPDRFTNDGQITKQPMRAITVSALGRVAEPTLLWDVGAGSGSIGIDWLRTNPRGRAVAFESHPERREFVAANAEHHGVADRIDIKGPVPESFARVPAPDRIFIGGGLTAELLDDCLERLAAGGRLVANAVTLESETILMAAYAEHGGELQRIQWETAGSLGRRSGWEPRRTIMQWTVEP